MGVGGIGVEGGVCVSVGVGECVWIFWSVQCVWMY